MRTHTAFVITMVGLTAFACNMATSSTPSPADANAGIDALNTRLSQSYRARDPKAYAALWTDSAVFEWPASPNVRGPAALGAMARDFWSAERDVDLALKVATRKIAGDRATEFGAFEQTWTDSAGARMTEYGRYVTYLVRGADGSWRMDRFFGFEDSTRPAVRPAAR